MEASRDFYEKAWKENEWDDLVTYSPVGRHINRWILKFIKKLPTLPQEIADIGCGNGKLLQYIAKIYPMISYNGSDLTTSSINKCKSLFPKGVFVEQNLNKIFNPFKKRVDLSICSEVIEHVEQDITALKNIALFSQYLILTVPAGPLDDMSKDMGHLRHYTVEDLTHKLHLAGFELLHYKVWGGPFAYPLYSALRDKAGTSHVVGKYSASKKLITHFLYYGFFLNDLFNFGNKIFILAKNKNLKFE